MVLFIWRDAVQVLCRIQEKGSRVFEIGYEGHDSCGWSLDTHPIGQFSYKGLGMRWRVNFDLLRWWG